MISFTIGSDIKRFKAPMLVSDNRYIFDAVQKYKETVAAKIKQDAAEYRIGLTDKETAALEFKLPTE